MRNAFGRRLPVIASSAFHHGVELLHPGRSLVKTIVAGRASPTVGTPAKVSTVGIELLRHRLKGTTVEFYDCAGQVDYAGMHQTFLSRRALYLLVWDVGRCHGQDGKALDKVDGQ